MEAWDWLGGDVIENDFGVIFRLFRSIVYCGRQSSDATSGAIIVVALMTALVDIWCVLNCLGLGFTRV